MSFIENVFSRELMSVIKSDDTTDINNIDRDLEELLVAGIFAEEKRHLIWVVGENENLLEKRQKLKSWLRFLGVKDYSVRYYTKPFEDPFINNNTNFNALSNKVYLVSALLDNKRLIVLTSRSALSIKIEKRDQLKNFFLKVAVDQEVNRPDLTGKLISMGYRARGIVEDKGDVAWRGSIVDVFPLNSRHPARIEIEGDRIISIRWFNPDTQKSIEQIKYYLFPTARFFLDFENNSDYFQNRKTGMIYLNNLLKDYRFIVSDRKKINDEFQKLIVHYNKIYEICQEKKENCNVSMLPEPLEIFDFPLDQEKLSSINETYDNIGTSSELVKLKHSIIDFDQEDIGTIKDKIEHNGYRLSLFSRKPKIIDNLREYFEYFHHFDSELPYSFENTRTNTLFVTHRDFQFVEKIEKTEKSEEIKSENLAREIQVNDLVVHQKHGIGKFVGFKNLGFENNVTEFLKIEYSNNEFLYVPVYELDVLSKYVAFEGFKPQLDKMGGSTWRQKQKKAKNSIITFAKELLQLYALRKTIKGRSYHRDPEMEDRLEQGFQFVETEDQKRAIRDVLNDLEAEYPM
ncbi:MAG TPA: CarD family transcriptional regulator, partial [Candidatus Deferrimicrobium sp.]|nr:CarD family transcriptional regulator [Candidatus Deferrimicrobium sp.]